METLQHVLDLFLHVESHLIEFIRDHGPWIYGLLFAIVFCETGLVVTPFLPGDSLLFAVGALSAREDVALSVWHLWWSLVLAGVLGDSVNYSIGHWLGPKVFRQERGWLNRKHLDKTHAFFERHGGKTIILARFVPIVRTYAPFVAGVGAMSYGKFFAYNVVGAVLWVTLFLWLGHFFGNLPWVKENLKLVLVAIIVLSVLPLAWEWWQARSRAKLESQAQPESQAQLSQAGAPTREPPQA